MADTDITLFYNAHRFDAMTRALALQGMTVVQALYPALDILMRRSSRRMNANKSRIPSLMKKRSDSGSEKPPGVSLLSTSMMPRGICISFLNCIPTSTTPPGCTGW